MATEGECVWGGGWCVGSGRCIFYFPDLCTELQVGDYPRDHIGLQNNKARYNPSVDWEKTLGPMWEH